MLIIFITFPRQTLLLTDTWYIVTCTVVVPSGSPSHCVYIRPLFFLMFTNLNWQLGLWNLHIASLFLDDDLEIDWPSLKWNGFTLYTYTIFQDLLRLCNSCCVMVCLPLDYATYSYTFVSNTVVVWLAFSIIVFHLGQRLSTRFLFYSDGDRKSAQCSKSLLESRALWWIVRFTTKGIAHTFI